MQGSVTVHIDAPAERVWALISDVTRIGEFSPETFEAEWLDGADGPRTGARFRGHVRRNGVGPVYWTTCTVLAADSEREFAFAVNGPGGMTVNTWRYRLAPGPDGTGIDVTESFQLPRTPPNVLYWLVAGPLRLRTNLKGMRATLERIKAIAEGLHGDGDEGGRGRARRAAGRLDGDPDPVAGLDARGQHRAGLAGPGEQPGRAGAVRADHPQLVGLRGGQRPHSRDGDDGGLLIRGDDDRDRPAGAGPLGLGPRVGRGDDPADRGAGDRGAAGLVTGPGLADPQGGP